MKPILFSTPMVQAILDGKKTQTRRVVKPQPEETDPRAVNRYTWVYKYVSYAIMTDENVKRTCAREAPIQEGDILWVRETWARFEGASGIGYIYKADDSHVVPLVSCIPDRWKPSIHMPKEAARIFLRVTDVRCERLNDITVKDCIAEGIGSECFTSSEIEEHFKQLWQEINGKRIGGAYSWDKNPWVWVYEFERCGCDDCGQSSMALCGKCDGRYWEERDEHEIYD